MDSAVKKLTYLLSAYLKKEKISISFNDEELSGLYSLSMAHDIAHITGAALKENSMLKDGEIKDAFERAVFTAVYRNGKLSYELSNIKKCFNEKRIPFIPLKGAVLMNCYPEPWMRTSSDIDVLVREEDLKIAADALKELFGCDYKPRGSHDIQFISQNNVHVELHYRLFKENEAANAEKPFSRIFDSALRVGTTSECLLTEEMFYYYHIAHMAKHIMNGGCGIRPFLDLWILDRRGGYDEEKEKALLEEGGLLRFSESAKKLSRVWFEGKEHDEVTKALEEYIVSGGVYGNMENKVLARQTEKGGGKVRYALSRIWLPYETMRYHYPTLDGKKALLPLYEVIRWLKLIFFGGIKRSVNELKINKDIGKSTAEGAHELLSELGLIETEE